MSYLRDKKGIKCAGTHDKITLCRSGYFNLVNGYKNPFINGVDKEGNHKYLPDTEIHHLNNVKNFDDDLRILLLKYITKAEEEIRTFAAYKFDEINGKGKIPWYQIEAYDLNGDIKRVIAVISKSYNEISRSELDYVRFYMDNHKVIPTWVLAKVINFSTFIDFVKSSKKEIKDSLCELYSIVDDRQFYNHKLLIGSLHWMRKVRNACAHNERIYTLESVSRNGSNRRILDSYFSMLSSGYASHTEQKLVDLFIYLKYYLETDDYNKLITQIKNMLLNLQKQINANAFGNVRAKMGIKDIRHLDILMSNNKNIQYNKF